jgi:hypothetical protein
MAALALAALLVAAAPAPPAKEAPFEPSAETFADAAACKAGLANIVAGARLGPHAAVEGPYDIAPGDVRAHWIDIEGSGHRITEHRCLAEKLSSRTWRHSMDGSEAEEQVTIDTMAAKAEWLKKGQAR